MKALASVVAAVVALGLAAFGILYALAPAPQVLTAADLPTGHEPDIENGRVVYFAGGCISCHAPGEEAATQDRSLPAGGAPFATPLGTFYPSNLTPDEETGIGAWSDLDFVNSVMRGVAPPREVQLYPSMPYTSYARMRIEDVLDLRAYLATLPPVKSPFRSPDVPLAGVMRPLIGWWKMLAMNDAPFTPDPQRPDTWNRGAYLVTGPGHCGECHTPRNLLMVMDGSRPLAGGPHPEGTGRVPSLRGLIERGDYKDVKDLATALKYGEIFGYDGLSAGGMGKVQASLEKLPDSEINAMAEYLASLR